MVTLLLTYLFLLKLSIPRKKYPVLAKVGPSGKLMCACRWVESNSGDLAFN